MSIDPEMLALQKATALSKIRNGEVPSEFCNQYSYDVPDFPADIEQWAKDDATFADTYRQAKRCGAGVMLQDCIKIAADRSRRIDERKLMVETRKYIAALWSDECNPKSISEATITTVNPSLMGATDFPLFFQQLKNFMGAGVTEQYAREQYEMALGTTVQ